MQRARAPCIPAACSRAGSRQPARPRTLAAAGQGASSSATTSACTVRGQRPCVCMRVCACVRVGVVETVAINWRHHETTTSTSRERERERSGLVSYVVVVVAGWSSIALDPHAFMHARPFDRPPPCVVVRHRAPYHA